MAAEIMHGWCLSFPLWLVYFSYVVGVGCALIFGFDLATGLLFRRASLLSDVVFSTCGAALVWIAADAHRGINQERG